MNLKPASRPPTPSEYKIYGFTALLPFLALGYIGVKARQRVETYRIPAATAAQHARLVAYRPALLELRRLDEGDAVALRALADRWVARIDAGEYRPVPPGTYDDWVTENGPRSEVARAFLRVARDLSVGVTSRPAELREGDLRAAFRVLEFVRRWDLTGPGVVGIAQRRAISLAGTLPEPGRTRLLADFRAVRSEPDEGFARDLGILRETFARFRSPQLDEQGEKRLTLLARLETIARERPLERAAFAATRVEIGVLADEAMAPLNNAVSALTNDRKTRELLAR